MVSRPQEAAFAKARSNSTLTPSRATMNIRVMPPGAISERQPADESA